MKRPLIYISQKKKKKEKSHSPVTIVTHRYLRHSTPQKRLRHKHQAFYTPYRSSFTDIIAAVDNFGARRKIRRINKVYSPEGSSLAKLPPLKRFPSIGEKGTAEVGGGKSRMELERVGERSTWSETRGAMRVARPRGR